ncbi:HNH endonuclease family protein [Limosilactobacillus fermentum]|uniref:HNH endonuclease family protein n=1 Tax=Limosilactobacillus fermentum TaxID=1613 RepID=UPI00346207FE
MACYVIYLAEKSKEQMSLEDIYQLFFAITDEFQPTLEHIYPQKVSKTTNWNNYFNQYSQNQKNKIKNSIGNLVIINRKKNDRLSNASFKDKKEHGNVCFKNGSIDERTIARNNNWTLKEIKNRGLDIFNFINTNWEIKIPRDLRIDFIGLGKVVTR